MDADLTQIMLSDGAPTLATERLDGLAGYQTDSTAERMNASLRHAHALGTAGVVVAVLLGVALLGLLSIAVLVSRRIWHRRFRPQWIGAMLVLTVAVTTASIAILHVGDTRLRAGRDDLAGFQAGQQAGGAAYEVAADPGPLPDHREEPRAAQPSRVKEPQS